MNHLVFVGFAESDLPAELWSKVESFATKVELVQPNSSEFESALASCDGLILRLGMGADEQLFERMPELKYVGMYGTGYGKIDTEAAKSRGIVVTNVADYSTEAVAELVLGMALLARRNLLEEAHRASLLDVEETTFVGRDLSALNIGVVGAGFIGRRTIEIFDRGIGAQVNYWSRTRRTEIESSSVTYQALDSLFAGSDVVSVHLALNDQTDGLIEKSLIDAMPSGATLINTAPNEVVDLEAVLARCESGVLTYAMDHADELEESVRGRLVGTPNVLTLPPIGYATQESDDRKKAVLVENIGSFLAGSPQNHVNA